MTGFNLEDEYGGFLDLLEEQFALVTDDDTVEHFGVKGMKWGVRKDRSSKSREPLTNLGPDKVVRKTASGERITMLKDPPTRLQNFIGRHRPKFREHFKNNASMTIVDADGKKIGEAQVTKKNADELNLVWLGINKSARGRGYATAVMQAGAEFGRQEGFKKLTLEVPGNSPDARHIYEKLGFKVTKEPTKKDLEEDLVWGGLTEMAYTINEVGHAEISYLEKPNLNELAYLVHYGVKGMRWGHHKKEESGSGRNRGSGQKSHSESKAAAKENAIAKEYMAIKEKPRSKEAAAKELAKNKQKFLAKADPSVAEAKGGLTDKQKTLLKVGIGVAAVGGLLLYAKYSNNKQIAAMREVAGKRIGLEQFDAHVTHSKNKTWGFEGYMHDVSFSRPEFTLPAGHTFHRISTSVETSFKDSTYATHSIEDFHRYVAAFRQEKGPGAPLHHINFSTKEDLKVPSLATTLETLREVMSKSSGSEVSKEAAKKTYQKLSGGGWHPKYDPHVGDFFKALSEKGYGAIVDEMDAGVIGETPIVVFAKHVLTDKVAKPLTDEAIKLAESSLVELTNRKL